jgi:predicted ATP-dependent endonuclease of OLD family
MLGSIRLKNFTAFSEADFKFAKGLNVIIGENGAGKTHVLKVAYSAIYVCRTLRCQFIRTLRCQFI